MQNGILKDSLNQHRFQLDEVLKRLQEFTIEIENGELQRIVNELRSNLNDPFLFVVIGEVKSGKSSFINALLQEYVCKVDPAPCTDVVQEIIYSEEKSEVNLNPHLRRIGLPVDILKTIAIVDTPGTNTVIAHHQKITQDFIPKSDLVLFVFSAKNPHTQSSWQLLDFINAEWRKKVVFVLQQADLARPEELRVNIEKVKEYAQQRSIETPRIFTTSAEWENDDQPEKSGFSEVREFIREKVTGGKHYILKLQSILATSEQIVAKIDKDLEQRKFRLQEDLALLQKIKKRLATGEQQSGFEIRSLVERLLASYDRICDEVRTEFKEGLSIFVLFKKTFASLFDKEKSINGWIADLKVRFEGRLNSTFEEVSADGSKHFVEGVRQLLAGLLDDLRRLKQEQPREDELFVRIGEQRQEVIREVEQRVARLLTNDSFANVLKADPSTIAPTVFGGGVLAIIGAIILSATHGAFFDVTGGVLTGTGVLLAGGVLLFKKNKIIRDFETGLNRGKKQFEQELNERLQAKLKMIYEDIDRSFVRFYDYVKHEEIKVAPLTQQFAKIQHATADLRQVIEKELEE